MLGTPGLPLDAQHDTTNIDPQHLTGDRSTDHDPQIAALAPGAQPVLKAQLAAVGASPTDDAVAAYSAEHEAGSWIAPWRPTLDHASLLA